MVGLNDPGDAPGGVAIGPTDGLDPGADVVTVESPVAPDPDTGGADVAPDDGVPPVVGAEIPPKPPPDVGGGELAADEGLPAVDGDEIPLGDDEVPPADPPPDDDEAPPEEPPPDEPPPPDEARTVKGTRVPARSTAARAMGRMAGPL